MHPSKIKQNITADKNRKAFCMKIFKSHFIFLIQCKHQNINNNMQKYFTSEKYGCVNNQCKILGIVDVYRNYIYIKYSFT